MPPPLELYEDSESDSISVTSTVESDSQDVYELEGILAERGEGEDRRYLVKWDGYDLMRSTWEPEDMFDSENTLLEWQERKGRILQGLETGLDVEEFEEKRHDLEKAERRRKLRRLAKRKRSKPMSPGQHDNESDSSESADDLKDYALRGKNSTTIASINSTMSCDPNKSYLKHKLPDSTTSPRRVELGTKPAASPSFTTAKRNLSSVYSSSPIRKTASPNYGRKGSGPLRKAPISGAAILKNWNAPIKPRKRSTASDLPKVAPAKSKLYTLGTKRKWELQGRNERAPNAEQLEFIDTKTGKRIQTDGSTHASRLTNSAANPLINEKTPFQRFQESLAAQNPNKGIEAAEPELPVDDLFLDEQSEDDKMEVASPTDMNQDIVVTSPIPGESNDVEMSDVPRLHVKMRRARSSSPRNAASAATLPFHGIPRNTKQDETPVETFITRVRRMSVPQMQAESPNFTATPSSALDVSKPPRSPQVSLSQPKYLEHSGIYSILFRDLVGDKGCNSSQFKTSKEDASDIYGNIIYTEERVNIPATFRGIHFPLRHLFLSIKRPPKEVFVWLKDFCGPAEYLSKWHCDGRGYIAAGHILTSVGMQDQGMNIAEGLKDQKIGGLFFAERYMLLVYPSGTPEWNFADTLYPSESERTPLRFLMRFPVSLSQTAFSPTNNISTTRQEQEHYPQSILSKGQTPAALPLHSRPKSPSDSANSLQRRRSSDASTPFHQQGQAQLNNMDAKDINAAFKRQFGFDLNIVLPSPDPEEKIKPKFFLWYPKERMEEQGILVRVLHALDYKSYSEYDEGELNKGEWKLFTEAPKKGVALIHASAKVEDINSLARTLRDNHKTFFSIDLKPLEGSPFAKQIFPRGGAFLLLDSLVIGDPAFVVRILKWYQRLILSEYPGEWKFVARPRFRTWLSTILMDRHQKSPASARIYQKLFQIYSEIVPLSHMDEVDDFQTPKEEAVYCSPLFIPEYDLRLGSEFETSPNSLKKNDDLLCKWFGRWSLDQKEVYRRFFICRYDRLEDNARIAESLHIAYRHVTVPSQEQFMGLNKIGSWESDEASKRHKEQQEQVKSATTQA